VKKIVVVSDQSDARLLPDSIEIVTAEEYLSTMMGWAQSRQRVRVINLCRSYQYQKIGYYVSLLAEARGHQIIPAPLTLQQFGDAPSLSVSEEADSVMQKTLARLKSSSFTLSVYFGKNLSEHYRPLCRWIAGVIDAPLVRARFENKQGWILRSVKPISLNEVPSSHFDFVRKSAREYFYAHGSKSRRLKRAQYNLAILIDKKEQNPPSDDRALEKCMKACAQYNLGARLITPDDLSTLSDFDALFIRATTAVNNFTYTFAQRAESKGLVVIDDPLSIVRCTNKVYLSELLRRHKLPQPQTFICRQGEIVAQAEKLGFPCVLKIPDSSFSLGVQKVEDTTQLLHVCAQYIKNSSLLLLQEYMPTEFDWRIGVLSGRALYACKYFMARGHWQIYNWSSSKKGEKSGKFETVPIEMVPSGIIRLAEKAASAIGTGLYGVDIKQKGNDVYVIEINDNPSIESGVEDKVLKGQLYQSIAHCFFSRIHHLKEQVRT